MLKLNKTKLKWSQIRKIQTQTKLMPDLKGTTLSNIEFYHVKKLFCVVSKFEQVETV